MTLNDKQKNVYNCFLKHYRNGEPYQPRKDFSTLPVNTISEIIRVSNFLQKFPHIDWNEFFGATRLLHPDEKCPPLSFFLTRAAIKVYNLYKQKQELRDPKNQFEEIKKGMHFIGMFCLKNRIPLSAYIHHTDGLMPTWIKHYREHNINPYCLMELGDVLSSIYTLEKDQRELYIKNLSENISKMKMDYFHSEETKNFVRASTKKIDDFLNLHLQNNKTNDNIRKN